MKKKNLELKKLNLEKMTVSSLNEVTGGTPFTYTPCSNGCVPETTLCPATVTPVKTCTVVNTTTVSF